MAAQVLSFFAVQVGVKQGRVLALVIFNIYMAAIALYARNSFLQENEISVKYRLDGNLLTNVVSMPNPQHLLPILMSFSMLMTRH